jgi:hypothetical protein
MRRSIETAYYMFKDHPNIRNNKLKFIVHPLLREKLHVSVDIPTQNTKEVFEGYKKTYNEISLDTSLLNDFFRNYDKPLDEYIKDLKV